MLTHNDREQCEAQIQAALAEGDSAALRAMVTMYHPADIADLLDRLDAPQRLRVFQALAPAAAAEVLDETSAVVARSLLRALPPASAGALLDRLPPDDAAEVLGEDVPGHQQALLAAMTPADAAHVRTLLQYPPKTAGRLMLENFVPLRPEMTASAALAYVRQVADARAPLDNLYVLDSAGRLVGVVALREVVLAPPTRLLSEFMTTRIIRVTPETDQEEVARLIAQYDLTSLPVVTAGARLLGIITVDDAIDVLLEESNEDVLRFGGVAGPANDQPYFTVSIPQAVRRRVAALLLLFVAESFTGSVLRLFEDELSQVVALSFFIPLLIGTGGNTGAQTVSTLIRGLAFGEIRLRDTWRVLARELSSGFLLGLLLGTVGFGRALLWNSSVPLALVVGLTLVVICTWANTVGSLIPLVAHRVGVDPAVISAPLITTLVDATGLVIYLLIAKALLGL
jgi:magnesium transporter